MSKSLWQTTDVWTAKLVLSALVTYLAQYEACSTNIAVQLSQHVASLEEVTEDEFRYFMQKKKYLFNCSWIIKFYLSSSKINDMVYTWTHTQRNTREKHSYVHLNRNTKKVLIWKHQQIRRLHLYTIYRSLVNLIYMKLQETFPTFSFFTFFKVKQNFLLKSHVSYLHFFQITQEHKGVKLVLFV